MSTYIVGRHDGAFYLVLGDEMRKCSLESLIIYIKRVGLSMFSANILPNTTACKPSICHPTYLLGALRLLPRRE